MLYIFDWDGTLADSQQHIVAAMQYCITELQLPSRTDQQCANMIGLGLREVAHKLFDHLNEQGVQHFCDCYSKHFLLLGQSEYALKLFDGVLETFDILQSAGHQLAVATGKSRKGLNRVLKAAKLEARFVSTRAADETASKPSPLMLQEILCETGMSVEQAVMIGDTSYDMAMAQAISMQRIAANYGVHQEAVLRRFDPCLVVNSIQELCDWQGLR